MNSSSNNDALSNSFTINELNLALSQCDNTSPGLDGIKFMALKNLSDCSKMLLLDIFNKCILLNCIPEAWRKVKTIAILKPGKDASSYDFYCPISLLSCPRKTVERMILNRLELWAKSNKILFKTQHGFRRGRGTQDCLALLSTDIQIAFGRKEELITVFLDVQGAYDSVLLNILHENRLKSNIPTNLANFIHNLMCNKEMSFHLNNVLRAIRQSNFGLPQG